MESKNAVVEYKNQAPLTIMEETNPKLILKQASDVANILTDIIEKQKLYAIYKGGKKHVLVDGWTTLGSLLKVYPVVEYCKRLDRENEIIYEAKVNAVTMSGNVVGSAEALCSGKETLTRKNGSKFIRWTDEHAVKSMAQTRAVSKALRYPLGWVMTLAGYEATPSEEMPDDLREKPVMTQNDGSEVLPPKKTKQTQKQSNNVLLSSEEIDELKSKNKHIKTVIVDLDEKCVEITKFSITRMLDKLLQDEKIEMDEFKYARTDLNS